MFDSSPVWVLISIYYLLAEDEIFDIYWRIEQKCRKYTKVLCLFILANQAMFMPPIYHSVSKIMVGDMDTSTWKLPFTTASPFGRGTVWGWYVLWSIQFLTGCGYTLCLCCGISYIFCCCMYIGAMCEHFDLHMRSIAKEVEQNEDEKNPIMYRKRYMKIKENFYKAVEIHVNIYE